MEIHLLLLLALKRKIIHLMLEKNKEEWDLLHFSLE